MRTMVTKTNPTVRRIITTLECFSSVLILTVSELEQYEGKFYYPSKFGYYILSNKSRYLNKTYRLFREYPVYSRSNLLSIMRSTSNFADANEIPVNALTSLILVEGNSYKLSSRRWPLAAVRAKFSLIVLRSFSLMARIRWAVVSA